MPVKLGLCPKYILEEAGPAGVKPPSGPPSVPGTLSDRTSLIETIMTRQLWPVTRLRFQVAELVSEFEDMNLTSAGARSSHSLPYRIQSRLNRWTFIVPVISERGVPDQAHGSPPAINEHPPHIQFQEQQQVDTHQPQFSFTRLPTVGTCTSLHPLSPTHSYLGNVKPAEQDQVIFPNSSQNGTSDMMSPMSPPPVSSRERIMKQFTPQQQIAAANILDYKAHDPEAAVPASLITAELAEVHDGRGWCLIGNCGLARAQQKRDPLYDPSKDTSRKRLDHLYDHIRDKHFSRRPFSCSMDPAWYAPLS